MDARTLDDIQDFLRRVKMILEAARTGSLWTPEQCLLELRMAATRAGLMKTKAAGKVS